MGEAKRDGNHVTSMLLESSSTAGLTITAKGDESTGRLLVDTAAGSGDVTAAANLGNNLLIRGDGVLKGVQNSGITVDDSDNLSGLGTLNSLTIPSSDFVGLTDTQTLTDKTLTAPIIEDAGFIADANGNEQIVFQTTTSAINHLEVTNAGTGNSPVITAVGDNADVGIIFQVKGNEAYKFKATASSPTVLELYEDTDNGTNHIEIKAPASLDAHQILTLPDATDTLIGKATTDTLTNKSIDLTDNTLTGTSAELATAISDETGSGLLVFNDSPTLVTPALGTPASGVMTNVTGTASGLTAGNVTTNANLTGIVTSVGNATAIANKAIAIAKLADGTDGELITWDASGVIATVAVGTADQVLTSNGVGAAPTFQDAGGGGGAWTLIETQVPPSGNTVTFTTDLGTYKIYKIYLAMYDDGGTTDNIYVRFNANTTAGDYQWVGKHETAAGTQTYEDATSDAEGIRVAEECSFNESSGLVLMGEITIHKISSEKTLVSSLFERSAGTTTNVVRHRYSGIFENTAALTEILIDNNGNAWSGESTITLMGAN